MRVLECRSIREQEITRLKSLSFTNLTLAVIQIGEFEENNLYLRNKKRISEELNIKMQTFWFNKEKEEVEIIKKIKELNEDPTITGIILQKPIPSNFSYAKLVEYIDPKKDIDGITSKSKEAWIGGTAFIPCTARSVLKILDYYKISLENKKVVILGTSDLAGMPLYQILKQRTTAILCNSKTEKLKEVVKSADIVISAIGKAKYLTKDYFKEGQVLIDVGTNYLNGSLVGDIKIEELEELEIQVTPVPGGVGALTPIYLFDNLYLASK